MRSFAALLCLGLASTSASAVNDDCMLTLTVDMQNAMAEAVKEVGQPDKACITTDPTEMGKVNCDGACKSYFEAFVQHMPDCGDIKKNANEILSKCSNNAAVASTSTSTVLVALAAVLGYIAYM